VMTFRALGSSSVLFVLSGVVSYLDGVYCLARLSTLHVPSASVS